MTVLAKPSANGTFGRLRLTAVPAALLCAIAVAGCSGGSSDQASSASAAAAHPAIHSTASPTACTPWTGLDSLYNITTSIRQMIGDEVIFGAGTQQTKQDGLAVVVYAESLDGVVAKLPPLYAHDVQDSVLSVAATPNTQTPEQLNTAANSAMSLATQIGKLCLPSA
jgi:hypothetical protein